MVELSPPQMDTPHLVIDEQGEERSTDPDEQALANLETKLEEFKKNQMNSDDETNNLEKNDLDAMQKDVGYTSDIFTGNKKDDIASKKTIEADSDIAKNPQAAFGQLNATKDTSNDETIKRTSEKQLTAEKERKLVLDWKNLGVNRCPVCKFSTDDEELFKNHVTTCTPPKLPDKQGPVLLTYNGAYKCATCVITWKSRAEFEEHVVCHIIDDPYVCITCKNKKNFASRPLIEKHARIDHPKGDSRCGLRGIKKGRKFVEDLEKKGELTLIGKLNIPKTPRNQIKVDETTGSTTISNEQQNTTATLQTSVPTNTSSTAVEVPTVQTNTSSTLVTLPGVPTNTSTTLAELPAANIITSPATAELPGVQTNTSTSAVLPAVNIITSPTTVELPSLQTNISLSTVNQSLATNKPTLSPVASSTTVSLGRIQEQNVQQNAIVSVTDGILIKNSMQDSNTKVTSRTVSTTVELSGIVKTVSGPAPNKSVYQIPNIPVDTTLATPSTACSMDSLFGIINKDTHTLVPASIPSKIQKIVSKSTSTENHPTGNKSPQYHVKHFTEFTTAPTITSSKSPQYHVKSLSEFTTSSQAAPSVTTVPSQPMILIPVGQVLLPANTNRFPLNQSGQQPNQTSILLPATTNTLSFPINQSGLPINHSGLSVNQSGISINQSGQTNQTAMSYPVNQTHYVTTSKPTGQFILPNKQVLQTNTTYSPSVSNLLNTNQQNQVLLIKSNPVHVTLNSQVCSSAIMPQPRVSFPPVRAPVVTKQTLDFPYIQKNVGNSILTQQLLKSRTETTPPPSYQEAVKQTAAFTDSTVKNSSPTKSTTVKNIALSRLPKKFLFRIKPGQGFVCEACRKFTRDEFIYRRHIWDHFHGIPLACKTCLPENIVNKKVLSCQLVNSIVCNLVKRSTEEQRAPHRKTAPSKQTTEVIAISDDEDDVKQSESKDSHATEVIVLDDDDDKDIGLQIKISSTYSLTDGKNQNLEIMTKKEDDESASDMDTSDTTPTLPALETDVTKHTIDKEADEEPTVTNQDEPMDVSQLPDNVTSTETGLIDESLSHSEKDSEELVSQAVTFMLKDSDPRNVKPLKEVEDTDNQKEETNTSNEGRVSTPVSGNMVGVAANSMKPDRNSNAVKLFENETVKQYGHLAFYMCGYENCSFSCLLSTKYREHLMKHRNECNYVCCHCGQKDYSEDSHVRHLYSHANAKVFLLYKCPVRLCKFRTNLLHMYGDHLKCHTTEELNIICGNCNKIFPSIESLLGHLRQNLLKFVNCPYCSFRFVQKNIVTKHIKISHPDKPRMVMVTSQIVCQEREINFHVTPLVKKKAPSVKESDVTPSTSIDIDAILDQVDKGKEVTPSEEIKTKESHSSRKEVEVKDPVKKKPQVIEGVSTGSNTAGLKLKINTSSGPKSLKCNLCSYLSYNNAYHIQHVQLHEKPVERERRFVCNMCPKATDALAPFKKHVANHIGRNEIKLFNCTICSYVSNQKCHIMDHCSDNHSGNGKYCLKVEITKSSETSCQHCDFKARQVDHVVQHEEMVHRVKVGTAVENKESAAHSDRPQQSTSKEAEVNGKKRKYHCDYCKNYFKHKIDLKEHMESEHTDIDDKKFVFYKCKYCKYTSTMKEVIVSHMGKEHPGKEIRILRKIETVDSKKIETEIAEENSLVEEHADSSKERVGVPDGKTYKIPFECPKCPFSNNLRINVMRHIKTHPELTPVREVQLSNEKNPSKKTARKSTGINKLDNASAVPKRQSSLIQNIPDSHPLQNPFTSVKDSISEPQNKEGNSISNPYILGENKLHAKLSACFIPLENGMKFKCRICQQKIAKKFVLHRHILDHLEIVFFRCKYCDEGSIEKTLIYGHIQKEHNLQPLAYNEVSGSELDDQFKEKIFIQNFNNTVDLFDNSERSSSPLSVEQSGLIMTAVHESSSKLSEKASKPETQLKEAKMSVNKCPKCRYTSLRRDLVQAHLAHHDDPTKTYTCSECDYLSTKINVIKHIYRQHGTHAKVVNRGKTEDVSKTGKGDPPPIPETVVEDTLPISVEVKDDSDRKNREDSIESLSSVISDDKFITNSQGKKIKTETLTVSKTGIIYEMKTVYKCKDCGEKRDSRSGLYLHFKNTKCKRPFFQCSLCSFMSAFKSNIWKHAKIRHSGKKVTILDLPMKDKMKVIKIPIKQDNLNFMIGNEQTPPAKSNEVKSLTPDRKTPIASLTTTASPMKNSLIRCQLCTAYSCESVMKLQFHINTAHGGQMLQCQECVYKTPLVKHMINHCTNVHVQKVAKYRLESKISQKKEKKEKEVKTEPQESQSISDEDFKFKCPRCESVSMAMINVKRHLYQCFGYKPFVCKYCDKGMQTLGNVKRHIDNVHDGNSSKYKIVKNEVIESRMEKIVDQFKREKLKHDRLSGKSRPVSLDKLELIEDGIRKDGGSYYCDFCGYTSTKRSQVRKHYVTYHPDLKKKRPLNDDSETEYPPNKAFKLGNESKLMVEVQSSDTDEDSEEEEKVAPLKYQVALDTDGTKQYKCVQCEYKTGKKKYLRQHMVRHGSRFFKCFYCDYTSKLITNAYRHVDSLHKGLKVQVINKKTNKVIGPKKETPLSPSLSATDSPARSGSSADYVSPVKPKKRSPAILKYCCNICPLEIEGMYHFRQHLAVHKEFKYLTKGTEIESKLSCGYCSYMAVDEFDFSSHISSHLGERPFKCAYCDYSGHQKGKVLSHTRNIHPDEEERVINKDKSIGRNSQILLVNFDPHVSVERVQVEQRAKKAKLLVIETDESSPNSSFEERADMKVDNVNSNKCLNDDDDDDEMKKLTLVLKKKIPDKKNFAYEVVTTEDKNEDTEKKCNGGIGILSNIKANENQFNDEGKTTKSNETNELFKVTNADMDTLENVKSGMEQMETSDNVEEFDKEQNSDLDIDEMSSSKNINDSAEAMDYMSDVSGVNMEQKSKAELLSRESSMNDNSSISENIEDKNKDQTASNKINEQLPHIEKNARSYQPDNLLESTNYVQVEGEPSSLENKVDSVNMDIRLSATKENLETNVSEQSCKSSNSENNGKRKDESNLEDETEKSKGIVKTIFNQLNEQENCSTNIIQQSSTNIGNEFCLGEKQNTVTGNEQSNKIPVIGACSENDENITPVRDISDAKLTNVTQMASKESPEEYNIKCKNKQQSDSDETKISSDDNVDISADSVNDKQQPEDNPQVFFQETQPTTDETVGTCGDSVQNEQKLDSETPDDACNLLMRAEEEKCTYSQGFDYDKEADNFYDMHTSDDHKEDKPVNEQEKKTRTLSRDPEILTQTFKGSGQNEQKSEDETQTFIQGHEDTNQTFTDSIQNEKTLEDKIPTFTQGHGDATQTFTDAEQNEQTLDDETPTFTQGHDDATQTFTDSEQNKLKSEDETQTYSQEIDGETQTLGDGEVDIPVESTENQHQSENICRATKDPDQTKSDNEVYSNFKENDIAKVKKNVETEKKNIFEKFKYEKQMDSEKEYTGNETKSNQSENVFDKFACPADKNDKSPSDEDSIEKDERGLFEKFAGECEVEAELESKPEEELSESPDHENIFEKFAREHSLEKDELKDSESKECDNIPEKCDEAGDSKENNKNIFEKMASDPSVSTDLMCSQTNESSIVNKTINDGDELEDKLSKNIFDKFATVAGKCTDGSPIIDKSSKLSKNESEEDMEIDELLETLDTTVKENKAEISKRGGNVEEESMDVDI